MKYRDSSGADTHGEFPQTLTNAAGCGLMTYPECMTLDRSENAMTHL